ncbi:glycoside hydrolase superfamily [Penicillium crustosum]|uniref:glycoside hydrolase superfamily n=1 Tax=Penicillium crustosum TaxID=36656 RepID=UPI0023942368|nr:glycoside hydrolase superfamily [Penicillium crustosum]KAJ5419424.1 glycoside hydrolase superfamily [Penicillium crustosum]
MTFAKLSENPEYSSILPATFLHGYASAAYQIEGATSQGGRGASIWDEFLRDSPENGDTACNSYHLWRNDIELLKQYGANSYRFSISWSRIKPLGGRKDEVNHEGIKYYNDLIDGLLEAGIEPTVTLFHYDVPLSLQRRYRGFAAADSGELVEDFCSFARLCFETFGDRVGKVDWGAPVHDMTNKKRVGHNCILVHGHVARLYREEFKMTQDGQIGIALNMEWVEPVDESPAAVQAANLATERCIDWFAKPIFLGTQTNAWDRHSDIFPRFSEEELQMLNGSADFFSVNHYGTSYATGRILEPGSKLDIWTMDEVEKSWTKDGILIGRRGHNGHPHTVPWGFRKVLVYCWDHFAKALDIPIIVYENGYAMENESSMAIESIIDDTARQEYYNNYFQALCDAVKMDGVQVAGYHAWSLLDNLEWHNGYQPRFGVTFVDREAGYKRIPKKSASLLNSIWRYTVHGKRE